MAGVSLLRVQRRRRADEPLGQTECSMDSQSGRTSAQWVTRKGLRCVSCTQRDTTHRTPKRRDRTPGALRQLLQRCTLPNRKKNGHRKRSAPTAPKMSTRDQTK